jgi:hypothetical protein
MVSSVVLLPAPFAPSSATISFAPTSKSRFFSTSIAP